MRASRLRWLVASGLVCGAFVAGGQLAGAQGGGAAAPVQWCAVVTDVEARTALGGPATRTDSGTACSYTLVADGRVSSVTVTAAPPEVDRENFAEALRVYADAANARFVSADVGEEAFATLGSPASQVMAREGDRFVALVLIDQHRTDEARLALLSDLARAALPRVP